MGFNLDGKTLRFNVKSFQEIRRLPQVKAELQRQVNRVLSRVEGTGGTYQGGVGEGRTRSRGYVVTRDYEAILNESKHHYLSRAISE